MNNCKWWQTAVFYQIYPRSFADGNGDGIGDFQGIFQKLDYLQGLGINAIWLSPFFPSPNWDWGYDVSDYTNVAPEYGTIEDFQIFLDQAHLRGMHVILDLVLNHTSIDHAWFKQSRTSRDNPKADWYIWKDPTGYGSGSDPIPPNNWQSCFDGAAWTYVPERNQFYYHYFMQQQPDLNWQHPQVKEAMWQVVHFWLDRGVDGFRLDAIGTIFEDPNWRDHAVPCDLASLRHMADTASSDAEKELVEKYWHDMFMHQLGGPGLHELLRELRSIVDAYPGDRLLVGEDDDITYQGNGNDELHLVFNFPLMLTSRMNAVHVGENQTKRLCQLASLPFPGWACNTLGNHDSPRMRDRFGDGINNEAMVRLNLILLMSLRGTPVLYYGEEIGMQDLIITDPSRLRDTMAIWYYDRLVDELHVDPFIAAQRAGAISRDKNRTPMQWRNAPNAGFCPGSISPWLPVNSNHTLNVNVEEQETDPESLLTFYRQAITMRKHTPALMIGVYESLHFGVDDVLAFLRVAENERILVLLNLSEKTSTIKLPQTLIIKNQVITSCPVNNMSELTQLEPYGFRVVRLV